MLHTVNGQLCATIAINNDTGFLSFDKRNPVKIHFLGCVKIPYRGYTISIHSEGEDIQIEKDSKELMRFSNMYDTFDNNLKCAIDWIDAQ